MKKNLFLFLLIVTHGSQAQLPVARLSAVFPPGGTAGSSLEVSVSGVDLDDAAQIHFSQKGIEAKPKTGEGGLRADPNKFLLTIASNVPPGIYEARIVCRFGISNPRLFVVSDRPESNEPSNNQSASSASELALDTVVNGHANANAIDYFQFPVKKGQRIIVECLAKAIDSRMAPVLILQDTEGHELDRNRRGGVLDHTALADGKLVLKVHDFLYRGGEDYFYRLSVGTGPHLEFVFPPCGRPGEKGQFTLYGRNLPGGTPSEFKLHGKILDKLSVEIELPANPAGNEVASFDFVAKPSDAPVDSFGYRLGAPQGVSNPVPISYAVAPVILEQAVADKPEAAQNVTVPCEYVGQFHPRNDRDWITFEAKKGEVFWIEVFSHRLGFATDPFVVVQRVSKNAKGEDQVSDVQELSDLATNIGGPEFNTATRDLEGRLEIKEDGAYRLQIRDLFNYAEDDPRLVYRLVLRKESPDFRLVALPQPPPPINRDNKEALPWTPFLRKGETIAIKVLAYRRHGFNGDVQLALEGLPTGVHYSDTHIEAGKTSATVLVTAEEKAAAWVGTVKVLGRARIGTNEVVRQARGGSIIWTIPDYNNEPVQSRIEGGLMLAVSDKEAAPISVGVEDKLWETSLAGKLQIPIKVLRRGDFNDVVKLKPAGIPPVDPMKEIDVAGKTNETMLTLDLTQLKIPVGTHTIFLQAQTKGKYRRLTPDEVKAAETALKAVEDAVKQGEKEESDLAAAAKKADEAFTAAKKAADEAAAHARTAGERLASAKTAAEKTTSNEDLASAKAAAEKEASEASARAKNLAEAKATAERAFQEASAKAKEAQTRKELAAKHAQEAKQMVDKAQPKDLNLTALSVPIQVKVTPAPITLSLESDATNLTPGAKTEIQVKITRLYGFSDPVNLSFALPKELTGLKATAATIEKDKTEGKLVIETAADAKPGQHRCTLQASLKLNNQDLKVEQPFSLKIAAANKPQ
ncbi:MAG: hypothetical protein FJ398_12265 [Verrucomicrobia bacterium]|nr:hypothetical protein [Verrucomicrobiota bacterium]